MYANLLGGLSPQQFLSEYWQKKPLLVRQALPGFCGVSDIATIFDLACDQDVESRLVKRDGEHWHLTRGPQKRSQLRGKRQPWTVLVQGLNLWVPEADALLHRFDFIPQARLDDLMVSYATDGGGVGPHFDNYDVFLIQGTGKRRWQIGAQSDRTLLENVPLKILANFQPEHDWTLEPGDLLYLPPHWAHNGIAVGECTTYSVGFRSPDAQELGTAFLRYLEENCSFAGLYADPDLQFQTRSGLIGAQMVDQVAGMLSQIRWTREDVTDFLGRHLTEPKPHIYFNPPEEPLERSQFETVLSNVGAALDPGTLLLTTGEFFYLNGERLHPPLAARATLIELSDTRRLKPGGCEDKTVIDMLHQWHCDGVLILDDGT